MSNIIDAIIRQLEASSTTMLKEGLVHFFLFLGAHLEQLPKRCQHVIWDLSLEPTRELLQSELRDFLAILHNAQATTDKSFSCSCDRESLATAPEAAT
jgi:hypothetical protein